MKKNETNQTEIGTAMLNRLEKVLSDIDEFVGKEVAKVNQEYRYDPKTFNADRYAVMIHAKNNLAVLEGQFNQVIHTFNEKVQFEQKIKAVSALASALTSAHDQIYALRNQYDQNPLVKTMKTLLNSIPRVPFKEEDFPLSVDSELSSQHLLNSKASEIKTTYHTLVGAIKEHQSHFNRYKKDIKFLTGRSVVFNAISHQQNLDFKRLNEAINHDFENPAPSKNAFLIYDLITFDRRKEQVQPQLELFNQFKKEFINRFPELIINNERQTLRIQGQDYPLTLNEDSYDFGYSNARIKLLTAMEEGDLPNVDYGEIYRDLEAAQLKLESFTRRQNIVLEHKNKIDHLLTNIDVKLKTIPTLETDKLFLDFYSEMQANVNTLKNDLPRKSTKELNSSIEEFSQKFEEYSSLQDQYAEQLKQLNDLTKLFTQLSEGIVNEHTRIQTTNKNDTRLNILDGLQGQVETHALEFTSLKTELLNQSADPQKLHDIEPIAAKINAKVAQSATTIKSILTDEQLEGLSVAKRNPFVAWFVKLIRPLLSYLNEDKPEKPGFFVTRTELSLKELRTNVLAPKGEKGPDRENEDSQHNSKP